MRSSIKTQCFCESNSSNVSQVFTFPTRCKWKLSVQEGCQFILSDSVPVIDWGQFSLPLLWKLHPLTMKNDYQSCEQHVFSVKEKFKLHLFEIQLKYKL